MLGDEIREKLFPREDPLNKRIQLGHDTYTVIGVFEKKGKMFGESQDNFVVIPLTTFDRRFPWITVGGTQRRRAAHRDGARTGPTRCPALIDKVARDPADAAARRASTSRTTSAS